MIFFMEPKLPKYLAGFCKNHNTQHAVLKLFETWNSRLKKGNKVRAIVICLPNAFDARNHNFDFVN